MQASRYALLVLIVAIVANTTLYAHIDISQQQAKNLIDGDDSILVVDVRESHEYCGSIGHIAGAWNLPWNSGAVMARYDELPTDRPLLVVCQSGGRSNAAATFLDSKGFSRVYDMKGGMGQWMWSTVGCLDSDHDGINDDLDTLPTRYNPDQADHDRDGLSNVIDADFPNLIILDRVDFHDFAVLGLVWSTQGNADVADLDHDGFIDYRDVALLTDHWLHQ